MLWKKALYSVKIILGIKGVVIYLNYLYSNRPSFPIVYTTQGTIVAAAYSATCCECKALIHHSSFKPKCDDRQEYFYDPSHSCYFQVTSQTVFETKRLDQLTFQIVFSGATYESQAQVYNEDLDETRLAAFVNTFKSP